MFNFLVFVTRLLPLYVNYIWCWGLCYVKVMKPVAAAMDLLQGEGDCYIGHVIPTIKGIQHKLWLLNDKSTIPLINAINNGLCKRFGDILTSNDYNVATMFIPKFKLNYLQPS